MKSFQQKRGFRNIVHSKAVLVLLAILLLFFAWGVIGFMGKMMLTIENRKIAENKLTQLQQEKEKLSTDISKLKSQDGVEESIREKFGLAKEGEGVIVIVDDKNESKVEDKSSGGFWGFLKNLFK